MKSLTSTSYYETSLSRTTLIILFLTLLLTVALSAAPFSVDLEVSLLIGITVVCLFPFYQSLRTRNFDIFEPIYLTIFSMWLAYGLNGFAILFIPDDLTILWGVDVFGKDLTFVLLLILGGLIAYCLGYSVQLGENLGLRWGRFALFGGIDGWWWKILVLYCLGWGIRILFIFQGKYTSFITLEDASTENNAVLYNFWLLSFYAYVLAWIYWSRPEAPRIKANLLIAGISTIELGYLLSQGSKTFLVFFILFPFVALHYHGVRVSLLKGLIAAFIVVFVIFPYVKSFRSILIATTRLDVGAFSLDIMAETVKQSVSSVYDSVEFQESPLAMEFINRWGGIAPTAAAVERIPTEFDYAYGRDFLLLPFAWIPRVVVPWKPDSKVPAYFAEDVLGIFNAGVSPFPIAEWYLNFGVVGVFLGMMLWGTIQKICYRTLIGDKDSLKIFLYVSLFIQVTNVNTYIATLITGLIQVLVVLLTIAYFMGGRFHRTGQMTMSSNSMDAI